MTYKSLILIAIWLYFIITLMVYYSPVTFNNLLLFLEQPLIKAIRVGINLLLIILIIRTVKSNGQLNKDKKIMWSIYLIILLPIVTPIYLIKFKP